MILSIIWILWYTWHDKGDINRFCLLSIRKDIFSTRMDSCHFEYPGSTHAIRTRTDGTVTIENSDEQAYTGARSLKICGTATGTPTAIYRQTYYQPEDFSDSRYDPSFSPVLYPGQTIRASVFSTEATGTVQMYAKDLHSGKLVLGEKVNLLPGQWITPQLAIPAMDGALLGEAGLLVECEQDWCIYLDDLIFIYKLCYDIYVRKQMIEKIIDRRRSDAAPADKKAKKTK